MWHGFLYWYCLVAGLCLALAGCFFVLLGVMIRQLKKWMDSNKTSPLSKELWIDWKITTILTELPTVGKWTTWVVLSVSWFSLGYVTRGMQQDTHLRTLQGVKIVRRYDDFNYLIRYNGSDYKATFCEDVRPTFDPGDGLDFLTYKVAGACWNITDVGTGWSYTKDPATGRDIKFAEVSP